MQSLWMIVASLLFALMGVCIKYAAVGFSSAEMICYRGLVSIVFMWAFARMEGVALRTTYPRMHAWRSFIGVIALGTWFYAIEKLPLATANALNYMSSIWIAVFVIAGSLLSWVPGLDKRRSPINASLVLMVFMGFGGVVLLLGPDLPSGDLFAGLIGLLSGIVSAFAYLQVVALSKVGEPETRTVFYFAVGSAVGGALGMAVGGMSPWSWSSAAWLIPIGVLASLGQLCMTRAYASTGSHANTLVVANLQYSGILFSALFGWLLFADRIPWKGWAGILAIVASGIAATVIRMRSVPSSPGEEH
jgi:drug/metabolite transporter (DMT)-like permease